MNKSNLITIESLLRGFQISLENRKISSFFYPKDFFKELLRWHYLMWKNEKKYLRREKDIKLWAIYGRISRLLDTIIINIVERILRGEEDHVFFPLFKDSKEQYIEHKDDLKYLENLFGIFCPKFFDNIGKSPRPHDIWGHYFPKEWKVTKNNLENKETKYISKIWLIKFLEWAIPRIEHPKEGSDVDLDTIVRELFPNVDPILWSEFLIFSFSTKTSESRVQSLIERVWNFGYVGRIFLGDYTNDFGENFRKREEALKKNTIGFIYYFNNKVIKTFTKKRLLEYKDELEQLKDVYDKKSREERNRLKLIYLVNKLIKYGDNKQN